MIPDSSSSISDADIIRRVLDGDINAYEYLLERYKHYVFKVVQRHVPDEEVEETAQNVFIRAYKALPGFHHRSGFRHWLTSIAVRTCFDFWRKRYKIKERPFSHYANGGPADIENSISDQARASYDENLKTTEIKRLLDWGLNQLPPKDRILLELTYLEGYTNREAAEILGWSLSNVKIRSHRSRKKLNNLIKDELEKSQNLDGKVKSSRSRRRKSRGMQRT